MKRLLGLLFVLVSVTAVANRIVTSCTQHVIWGAPQAREETNNQYLCRIGYAVNYNYNTKVATYVVETLKPELLVKNASRNDDFREDLEIPVQYRVTLKEYVGSGMDRGHMAPAANFTYDAKVMSESFLLSNMMPQLPGNNRGIWKYLEEYTRYWANLHGQLYIITGTIHDPKGKKIGNNVSVPSYIYKIVIDHKKSRAIAFLFPNEKLDPKTIQQYVVSIGEIEDYTGLNFSPAIPVQLQGMEKNRSKMSDWQ